MKETTALNSSKITEVVTEPAVDVFPGVGDHQPSQPENNCGNATADVAGKLEAQNTQQLQLPGHSKKELVQLDGR